MFWACAELEVIFVVVRSSQVGGDWALGFRADKNHRQGVSGELDKAKDRLDNFAVSGGDKDKQRRRSLDLVHLL